MSLSTRLGPGSRRIFPLRTSREVRACLFCSLSRRAGPPRRPKSPYTYTSRRRESTVAVPSQQPASDTRTLLIEALQDLKKHAPNHVNLSRLQLALQGLQTPPGQEPIRVAVWALSDGTDAGSTAREVLRLLLADPLNQRQPWEEELAQNEPDRPLVVRVGPEEAETAKTSALITTQADLLREMHVSSPVLNGLGLEFLVIDADFSADSLRDMPAAMADDVVLVPTIDIESAPGRYTPITTPVHKSLVVSRGIGGVAATAALPISSDGSLVLRAVDLPGLTEDDGETQSPILPVDVAKASKGVSLLRRDINHAVEYEHLWFESRLPAILDWLRAAATSEPGKTKPAVRSLVASLLQTTAVGLRAVEAGRLSSDLTRRTGPAAAAANLGEGLARWAEEAHAELRDQLNLAFAGRRWRKLGWWKLFWRADDVAALATQMLRQSFLPGSEKKVIYLAGRIQSAVGSKTAEPILYAPPAQATPASQDGTTATSTPSSLITGQEQATEWPTHISFTRRYLEHETVPALQALAQRLVIQAAGTSGLGCALSALLYVSSSVTGLYEAGAVAALALVWSLRRMQKSWETARQFWEGEVREEGRKSVRAVERSLGQVLETRAGREDAVEEDAEVVGAREIVARAEEALARLE